MSRVTLPRQLTLAEITLLHRANPNVEFEAFIFFDKCANLNAVCRFPALIGGALARLNGCVCEEHNAPRMIRGHSDARDFVEARVAGRTRVPVTSCGACAMYAMVRAGVISVKVASRGYPTELKVWATENLCTLADDAATGDLTEEEFVTRVSSRMGELLGAPCTGTICYYPEVRALWKRQSSSVS